MITIPELVAQALGSFLASGYQEQVWLLPSPVG